MLLAHDAGLPVFFLFFVLDFFACRGKKNVSSLRCSAPFFMARRRPPPPFFSLSLSLPLSLPLSPRRYQTHTCQDAVLDVRHQGQVRLRVVEHGRAHLALQRERHLGVGPDRRVERVGERVQHELGVRERAVARERVEDEAVAPAAEAEAVVEVRRDRDRQALLDGVLEAGGHARAEDVDAAGVGRGARGLVVGVLKIRLLLFFWGGVGERQRKTTW